MTHALEDQPRVAFRKNPLKVVVAQLRFPPIYSLDQSAGVAPFQEAIRSRFPFAEARAQEVSFALAPGAVGSSMSRPGPWRFTSEDAQYVAAISSDFLTLETTSYSRFEPFQERFAALLEAAEATLPIGKRIRLGLRYIDEIQHPDAITVTDWRRFLRPELLGITAGDLLADRVTQALQQISVKLEEGGLTIRHGYVGQDGSSVYAIDLDAFNDSEQPFDRAKTIADLHMFKRWAWSFFIQSITDELVAYLEPEALK